MTQLVKNIMAFFRYAEEDSELEKERREAG